jgi:radical SAM protein with 4Fe4S-binding SPASM domain
MFTIHKKEKDNLVFKFDVPVSSQTAVHPEFIAFRKLFEDQKSSSFIYNQTNEIEKIVFDLYCLFDVIDRILPEHQAPAQKELIRAFFSGVQPLGKGLEINFHQNPFDTSLRYWNFLLHQGHFIDFFLNRMNWYMAPKIGYVMPFPLHVDIESASTCNMNCPMCYRDQLKKTGQMSFRLFQKAIDECVRHNVFSIRLSWRGETLTHPKIKDMIAYATARIRNVSFLTNAFFLDDEMIKCFIDCKVSYIAVSFDGIGKIYESIRHPAVFDDCYQKLANLQERKKRSNSKFPQVRLCTIWPAIKDDPDEYYQTMKNVSDYIVCNPYINFKGPMKIKTDFICQYPWERIVIAFDGDTQCCTGWNADDIILGNLNDISIHRMWHSDSMKRIRSLHASGNRMKLNSCADCRHGSEGDPNIHISKILDRRY